MNIQRIEQANEHFAINSLLYTPDTRKDRNLTILMGHGFSVSKHHLDGLASYLCYFGYEVINLDFPGHKMGASRGKLEHPSQLVEALQLARQCTDRDKIVLLGHSMGAAAAVRAATEMEEAVGLVVLGMGADPTARFDDKIVTSTLQWGALYVEELDGKEFLLRIKDDLLPRMKNVSVPSLVVGGTKDFIIPVQEVKKLAEMAQGPNTLKLLECNHSDIPELGKKEIRQWLEKTY